MLRESIENVAVGLINLIAKSTAIKLRVLSEMVPKYGPRLPDVNVHEVEDLHFWGGHDDEAYGDKDRGHYLRPEGRSNTRGNYPHRSHHHVCTWQTCDLFAGQIDKHRCRWGVEVGSHFMKPKSTQNFLKLFSRQTN